MKKRVWAVLVLAVGLVFASAFSGFDAKTFLTRPFSSPSVFATELSQPQTRATAVTRRQAYDPSWVDFATKTAAAKEEINTTLGSVLARAVDAAGSVAKNAGQSVGNYIQTKQLEKRQQEILETFYRNYFSYESSYKLSPAQQDEMLRRVEDIYITEAMQETPQIDLVYFRDMRLTVKKVYSDMMKETARDGAYKTYYLSGQVESTSTYDDGELEGTAVFYAPDGSILYIDTYHQGFRLNRKKYDAEGKLEFSQDYPSPYSPLDTQATVN